VLLKWLDRLWLAAIAVSAAILAPIWVMLWIERIGLPLLLVSFGIAVLYFRYRH
jgi:hypothetical protein